MGLLVVHPGAFSTVQDRGRFGYRAWGVPIGGAFDAGTAAFANGLVGNPWDCAVVELTMFGGTYEAQGPLALALAGAPMEAELVGRSASRRLSVPSTFTLHPGERLVLGGTRLGARTYLAVHGGWRTTPVLGSRSQETRLKAGECLPALSATTFHRTLPEKAITAPNAFPWRIVAGPDAAHDMDRSWWERFVFRVGPECDRMGVRLEGPPLPVAPDGDRLSAPVAPGGIQVVGGQPIALGVACGTMGGYPLIAHVIDADLRRLAHARPGDSVRFRLVSLESARALNQKYWNACKGSWREITALACQSGIELA